MLVFSIPLFALLWILIKLDDGGSLFFKQRRAGKNKKSFIMYKVRTMVLGAEKQKRKYLHLNEAGGPVFKIYEDPRYTRIGKLLAHSGLDELPQLINIIKGEMSFVGPRPLPISEAKRVPKIYEKRFSVAPGITSLWVVRGAHSLSFDKWMKLDLDYIKHQSLFLDLKVAISTVFLMLKGLFAGFNKQ
ncbi:MAG: Exopolysaccharide biosynthesis polyprenyl glycosylphosphotransferase [Candidatus Woesebacteria bacterium GW2011_GWC2_47_16]|uniref:Exopolysaccharide biosynthesis polyprenyl glycosylphosphotransferase n=8 Tax=Candidatus Woeseibacteriota TaxID=1752722 RepID=A0A0G1T568_9BACT|nr:MAG: Exopolysaccharide biosynthesis polyprenyl glycosylphosphotransferase [Candidatus Woesebacteria bacterium GW2011_GWE1_45_18]KKU25155.1 MAG: Exopolysaccharide biosynthesis polyprenyl glycosylphosphotransferase [Candidatus Woesebacteria bacterium GW2011_GWF1_46_13]KKU49323.1 MAG: Exopolysaccharide biosynthesis polyprenyl glycosylphosphotransferase [Candidatus Woesebacteria bacterium GW2011_GWF2_46_8]KKU65372.1 MAG: Exopolysaccharide biosynthesis polyprenyl glycosylphosphotransferase [Candid